MSISIQPHITVCIPSIPPRQKNGLLSRCIRSIEQQTLPASRIIVETDLHHNGAAATRQRAIDVAAYGLISDECLIAFIDDDDEMMPHHLERLYQTMIEEDADYVFSWFEVVGGVDPFPLNRHQPFNPEQPKQTTITTLVKAELAIEVGFMRPTEEQFLSDGNRHGEDYQFTLECIKQGAKIVQVPNGEATWYWHHDSGNTSGLGDRW